MGEERRGEERIGEERRRSCKSVLHSNVLPILKQGEDTDRIDNRQEIGQTFQLVFCAYVIVAVCRSRET